MYIQVNDVEMTGKTQSDAVAILRNTKLGSVVNLVVSRQVVEDDKFSLPRELVSQTQEICGDIIHLTPSTLTLSLQHLLILFLERSE